MIGFYSIYLHSPEHGGGLRTQQTLSLLRQSAQEILTLENAPIPTLAEKISGLFRAWSRGYVHRQDKMCLYWGGLFLAYQRLLREKKVTVLVIETLDYHGTALAAAATEAKIKWVACPHNLDSLLHPPEIFKIFHPHKNQLTTEIDWLSLASKVFAISSEETFLLKNLGLDADTLPVFPPVTEAVRLQGLRNRRHDQGFILVLGSAINKPTREGMEILLRFLSEKSKDTDMPKIVVAGNGTEGFKLFSGKTLVIEGGVSNERLNELISGARFVWVHQETGVGALSRIPVMLLAGVPVLACEHAARSAMHLNGVTVYTSLDQGLQLSKNGFTTPPVPERPLAQEKRFIEAFR